MAKLFSKLGYVSRVLSGVRLEELNKSLEKAKERSGRNKASLFLDMLWCSVRYGAGYHDYVMFGFYDMDGKHRDTYVTRLRNKKLITTVNDPETAEIFDHKVKFNPRFREYLGRDFLVVEDMTLEQFKEFVSDKEKIFCKPDVGESGKGIARLAKADFESEEAMFRYIKEGGFGVIGEMLVQHDAMNKLYPGAVNSMRIVTLLVGAPGHYTPQLIYAVVKIGAGGKYVDNLENGGMFCPIDYETGKITGVGHTSALTTLDKHPDTGVPLIGYQIPYVKEAIELCKKAALEEPGMRLVGWDCAITPNGPAIIEGNDYPGYDFWQQPEHTPDRIGLWHVYKELVPELK
ncbi:sugar-transfer associated ATP-grasp domain-containing protein [uncultured Neglectibacter sp.]|uniref:sugar-transfer associated ATP-grasp domain-containing protein n=1 Tax=uncultured Neglectibacter sp. TaxID=1924108 RepID=UPI0034DFBE82